MRTQPAAPTEQELVDASLHAIDTTALGRALRQQTGSSTTISSTTAQAIGIVFGGVLLIIILSYCLTVMRRKRDRAQAVQRLQAQVEHDEQRRAARAERRRRRLEPKGVPAHIIESFPTKQYLPPEKPVEEGVRIDNTTRGKMMNAAASALTQASLDHERDDDDRITPPAPVVSAETFSAPVTMLSKVTSAMRSRSKRYAQTPRTTGAENPAAATPAPWEVDPRADLDPTQSLAAAHRASCAAASQMGKNPPSLRRNSSKGAAGFETQPSIRVVEDGGFKDPLSLLPEGSEELPQCAICLCDFEPGDVLRVLPCEHDFHQSCIDSWMQQHRTCPLCRHVLWVDPNPPPQDPAAEAAASRPQPQFPPPPSGTNMLPPR